MDEVGVFMWVLCAETLRDRGACLGMVSVCACVDSVA